LFGEDPADVLSGDFAQNKVPELRRWLLNRQ